MPGPIRSRSCSAIGRAALALAVLCLAACRQDMHDQPRLEAFEHSDFFSDGRGMRPLVDGTVARGHLDADELLFTGKEAGQLAERFPFQLTSADLERGRERFDIYCAICHDHAGEGRGMAVDHGVRQPASLLDERLRAAPPGYFFDVITSGFGVMLDYSDRIDPPDRWRIVAYIRALQLSRNAPLEAVPASFRQTLEASR